MLIRKLFKFENAHIVRGCSTRRCSHSIHGHSYKVELLLEAHALDHGQMVYDFGLLKQGPRTLIDAFDHAVAIWSGDDPDYITACQRPPASAFPSAGYAFPFRPALSSSRECSSC
ncbi:MAG: 6-pyruvoyl tetrahydrobiopterin synthase [Rhodocyclaceae bacterium]|nr:MAG: 6-pyruvoyl tetrahydrobiopterin synthase [Rhodocyclaceae bacterium]